MKISALLKILVKAKRSGIFEMDSIRIAQRHFENFVYFASTVDSGIELVRSGTISAEEFHKTLRELLKEIEATP